MNLLSRVIIAALIVIVLIVVGYFALSHITLGQQVSSPQAVTLVVNYLKNTNPNTLVNVTNVTPSIYPGSWHILTAVAFNATSPCPSYVAYSFDYPQYGFVYRVQNNYTSNCMIYGLQQNKSYILAAAPLAIARSYNLSIPIIQKFVAKYGYKNVTVHASYFNSIIISSATYNGVWIVNYTASRANYSIFAAITQVGGKLVANYTLPH